MAQSGKDREVVNSRQNKPLQKKELAPQETGVEITQAPEERVPENENQHTERNEALSPDTGFMANSQTRQLTICIVAFAVGIMGIALLVLKENLAMLVCGSLFFALGASVIIAMAGWRCYDAVRHTSIGIRYAIARTRNTCTNNAEQQTQDVDVQNSTV
ncbi:uncharacterized protein LOC144435715 [Glandiceps talaboti]